MGNLVSDTDALGAKTSYTYDAALLLSKVTYANGAKLTIDYDKAGNITAETDALGNEQTYAYDAVGRMSAVTDALPTRSFRPERSLASMTGRLELKMAPGPCTLTASTLTPWCSLAWARWRSKMR